MTLQELSPLSYGQVLEILDELPTAVRVVRRIRRISMREAAEESGISHAQFGKIEDGHVDMRVSSLRLLLHWLNSQPETEFPARRELAPVRTHADGALQ